MKYALVLAGLLAGNAFATTHQEPVDYALKAKFNAALSIVMDATNDVTQQSTQQGAPAYPTYQSSSEQQVVQQAPLMLNDYDSGKVTQQITVTLDSEAGQLLSEVSDIVFEMGLGLFEGALSPTIEVQNKVCKIVDRGFAKRRYAVFVPGYASLHHVFQSYLDQFELVSYTLDCPLKI